MKNRKEILQITNPREEIYLSKGLICIYSFKLDSENKSRCKVRIKHLWENESDCRVYAEIEILEVYVDDSGNDFFKYLKKTGKTMNASLKYLTPYFWKDDIMTYEEALKELKHEIDMIPKEPPNDFVGNENVWFKEHEKIIDAHNKAIEALEKQIQKKPKMDNDNGIYEV